MEEQQQQQNPGLCLIEKARAFSTLTMQRELRELELSSCAALRKPPILERWMKVVMSPDWPRSRVTVREGQNEADEVIMLPSGPVPAGQSQRVCDLFFLLSGLCIWTLSWAPSKTNINHSVPLQKYSVYAHRAKRTDSLEADLRFITKTFNTKGKWRCVQSMNPNGTFCHVSTCHSCQITNCQKFSGKLGFIQHRHSYLPVH